MEGPTKYARSGDVHIAYRVFGDGPRDIVLIPGTISHVELLWEVPSNEHLLKRLIAFARVIVFDKRGQGLSDRVAEQTLEERVGDVRAVMDAAGSERATIYGWSEGGPMCLMFAATYPARTSALVLFGTFASIKNEPWMVTGEAFKKTVARLVEHWGEGSLVRVNAPSWRDDPAFLQWFAKIERAAASPGSVRALMTALLILSVLTRTREAPPIPASCATELRRADRPARAGAAAAGRRRHFILAELLLADSGSGRRWSSGDRGDR